MEGQKNHSGNTVFQLCYFAEVTQKPTDALEALIREQLIEAGRKSIDGDDSGLLEKDLMFRFSKEGPKLTCDEYALSAAHRAALSEAMQAIATADDGQVLSGLCFRYDQSHMALVEIDYPWGFAMFTAEVEA